MNNGVSRIVMQSGDLYKISKDREGVIQEELLTPNWFDWVDYWSVDFDYESKPEIIRFPVGEGYEEHWTGSYMFENEWQSFRSKENYNLDFMLYLLTSLVDSFDQSLYKSVYIFFKIEFINILF